MAAPWFYPESPEWADMPQHYRDFFDHVDAKRCFRQWLNACPVSKRRVDQRVSRMLGRHPDDVDEGNYAIWYSIWDDRFQLMAVELNSRRMFYRPETPEVEDRPAP